MSSISMRMRYSSSTTNTRGTRPDGPSIFSSALNRRRCGADLGARDRSCTIRFACKSVLARPLRSASACARRRPPCGDDAPTCHSPQQNMLKKRQNEAAAVTRKPREHDDVGRMEFLLTLRRRGISDAAVLRAMEEVPRERFVEEGQADIAYADQALPIACGQRISQPYVVAYMTELLALRPDHRVLEVGTGSGYQAAVLSRLAQKVVTIERYRTLAEEARARFRALGYDNIEVVVGDGLAGVPQQAPYDRIMVTAAAESVPEALLEQLAQDGIMVLPLGPHDGPQQIVKLTKSQTGLTREELIAVRFVPLLPGTARELTFLPARGAVRNQSVILKSLFTR